MLAFYHYPFTHNNKFIEYTESDLSTPEQVQKLFDYCQILEAYITYQGWQFLIEKYGWEQLFQINAESDWIDSDNIHDFRLWVENEMEKLKKHGIK